MADYQRVMTPSQAINALDLEPMKAKLIEEGEGHGWTLEKADAVGEVYRCFFYLNLKFPERYLVPTKDIDLFWHQHILDTQKYAEDCQRVFGKILHHFPYVGMRGEEDAAVWKDCFQKTLQLFRTSFPKRQGTWIIRTRQPCASMKHGPTCRIEFSPVFDRCQKDRRVELTSGSGRRQLF
ncbi:glycine-rich domain-containing protein-like [Tumebacillus sp. DT12]|uniref:Glycine-rich domain-containing protein-like n=1 Tax=Tumebacillus lacus TaxID=2995335 RepID=A0ABT3X1Y0_9BACL|nr:glycine-rich domain-containing protein-like [Tumebacillus lacus]MCX7570899.1 glycine-rich domain-containing protein-like [Tumebacillus lacus]